MIGLKINRSKIVVFLAFLITISIVSTRSGTVGPTYALAPTFLLDDGFESGDLAGWSGTSGSPTVVGSPVHHGAYALQCDASGEVVYRTGFSGYSTVYVRFYVQINALPASGQSVKIAKATNTGLMAIWELYFQKSDTGALQIRLKSSVPSTLDQYFAYDYAVGTWYCFEVKYSQHASAGEYRVWLDGVEILSRTGVDTSGREFGRLEVGIQWSNFAVTTYHDCVVISETYIGQEPGIDSYTLNISVIGSGSTVPPTGEHEYASGDTAIVTATADSGWILDHWLLDGGDVGSTNPIEVLMGDDHALTAVFVEVPNYGLIIGVSGDGEFESGDLSAWSGYSLSPSVVTSPVHDGSYALQCDSSGEVVYRTGFSGYSTVYVRFYVQINALPASGQSVKIAKATNTGSIAIWELYFMRSSGGTLQIRLKSSVPSTLDQYFAYDYAVGTWYCFEVKYYQHSTNGEYRVWLDGAEILSRTGVDTSGREFGRLEVGIQWSNFAVTTYHDCVVISETYIGQEPEQPSAAPPSQSSPYPPGEMIVGVDIWWGITRSQFLNDHLAKMKECGIQMVRINFGELRYMSNFRSLVPAIVGNGIDVFGLLIRTDLAPNNVNTWGDWVYDVVSEFKNYVHVWEIWNEPNLNKFFSGKDPVKYTNFLKRAYTEAKRADPTCFVLGGSIVFTHNTALNFLRAVYNNGGGDYMDALSCHPYCDPYAPDDTRSTPNPYIYLTRVRDVMVDYGEQDKTIWITEVGWSTNENGQVGDEKQAQYLVQALEMAREWGWVETFITIWKDSSATGELTKGLLRTNLSRKPSFYAVEDFING